jgi:hypothetical protein
MVYEHQAVLRHRLVATWGREFTGGRDGGGDWIKGVWRTVGCLLDLQGNGYLKKQF